MGFVHLILLKLQMYLNTENLPNETTENVLITLLFFLKIYSSSIPWYVNAFFPTKKKNHIVQYTKEGEEKVLPAKLKNIPLLL